MPARPVATTAPVLVIDPGLPAGRHRFRLEVVDATGRRSQPAECIVTVVRPNPPPPSPRLRVMDRMRRLARRLRALGRG